jgi:WD40 repeat protein
VLTSALRRLASFAIRAGALLAVVLTVGLAVAVVGVWASQPEKPQAKAHPPAAPHEEQRKTELVTEVKTGGSPVDRQGDPLPEGALARLGTCRLGHGAVICSIAFSGDNKLLATAGFDSFVNVWDASTGQRLLHVGAANFRNEFNSANVALSPDGSCLATAWVNSPPELWDVRTGKKLRAIGDTLCRGSRVQFSANGKYLTISDSADGTKSDGAKIETAVLAEVETGKVIFSSEGKLLLLPDSFIHLDPHRPELSLRKLGDNEVSIQFTGHEGSVNAAALTPDGKKLFTHGSDRTIRVWDTTTGKELRRLDKTPETPCQLVPAPDASNVLTLVSHASSMQCWDVTSGKVRWTATTAKDGFVQAKFLPGGNTIVTGHSSGRLRQWDVGAGKEQKVIRATFDGTISLMVLSPDGKTLATSSNLNGINQKVYLWDAATLTPKAAHQGHSQQIVAAAFSPNGRIVATSGLDRTVRLWEPRTGNLIRTIETPTNASRSLVFTPDGKTLTTANGFGVEGEVRFWEVETGKEIRKFKADRSGAVLLAMAPDGKQLFTSGSDDRFRCWDLDTFKQLGDFGDEKPSSVLRIALSPNGSTFATAHMDGALRIWDARTFKKRYQLPGEPRQYIGALAFSPDNSLLAWSDGSAGIRLTDAASGKEVRRLPSPAGSFDGIVFAPDGKTLAWGINAHLLGVKNVVGVWEVRSGQLRRTLDGSDGPTLPLAHSPNGALLVTAGSDCSALVWDMNRRLNGKQAVGIPSPEKLEQCWRLLADHDAAKAFDGMETFTQFPEQGVARIAEDLKPIPPRAPAEKVAALLRDLDGDLFETREAATRELERLDETVIADLQRLAKKSESAEARTRAEHLRERMGPIRLQRERAIEILERIGNTSAVKLLKSLADGLADAPLTRDAGGALQRLNAKE